MRRPTMRGGVAVVLAALALAGCGPRQAWVGLPRTMYTVVNGDPQRATTSPDVGQAEWTLARERFARMRSEVPQRPYVERVQIGVTDPRSGKVYQSRGAVAVSPGHAVRLVLVGPGGMTAMDVWVTRDRFRISIPAVHLEKRGGRDSTDARGLPIGFLRWWFLAPLDGELVLARSSKAEVAFLLRDGASTSTIRSDGEKFFAIRREGTQLEGLEWTGRGLAPSAGASGKYIEGQYGLRVRVLVEEVLPDEPDPSAFRDPDAEGADAESPAGEGTSL